MQKQLCLGVDRLTEYSSLFKDARIGLITTPTGRTSDNRSTISMLQSICNLRVLFGPEHGIRGDCQAGAFVPQYTDIISGLPVYSLYGKDSKRFSEKMLDAFDILVYDIQDIGSRYYTFLSTLLYAIEDCAKAGKRMVVLDRPNPLGGKIVEGDVLDMSVSSFVGCYSLTNRYALTAGEFALMANSERQFGCDITVVPCAGWHREMSFQDWGLPWIMPSLNIPRFETALLYIGTCLFEGTNVSEGRGTADPFAIIGAPYITDAEALTMAFNKKNLLGVIATPLYFEPSMSKYKDKLCGGVHLHITDTNTIRPLTVGITLLSLIRNRWPRDFAFLPSFKECGKPFISLLAGHRRFEQSNWTAESIFAEQAAQEMAFLRRKQAFHLY
jgi:uncharacterized protein YbbC (DUF1343 family)